MVGFVSAYLSSYLFRCYDYSGDDGKGRSSPRPRPTEGTKEKQSSENYAIKKPLRHTYFYSFDYLILPSVCTTSHHNYNIYSMFTIFEGRRGSSRSGCIHNVSCAPFSRTHSCGPRTPSPLSPARCAAGARRGDDTASTASTAGMAHLHTDRFRKLHGVFSSQVRSRWELLL